jgi:hypothetical protein
VVKSPIPLPIHISFCDWANQLWLSINELVPIAFSENKWREWAQSLNTLNSFSSIPDPNKFKTWQDWAQALLQNQKFND